MEKAVEGDASKSGSFTEPSDRISRITDQVMNSPVSICLERPRLFSAFWRSKQGREAKKEHAFVRRAKALAYVYEHRTPQLWDDELILGSVSTKRVGANYYHEGGSINILEDLFRLKKRQVPIHLSFKEKLRLVGIGLRTAFDSVGARALLRPGRISHFLDFFIAKRYFITEEAGIAHQVGGYWNVVHHGLKRVDEVARRCLETRVLPDQSPINPDQEAFYRSVRIAINGIRSMANNLADEAQRIADNPDTKPTRKSELMELAEACRHVPYEPARTFVEGLQACWIVHLAMLFEDFEQGMSFGRLDQILWPLYKKDIETARLTPERTVEILAGFGLKTCETMPLYSDRIDRYFSGQGVAQGITLGGVDDKGCDVTNELSGLFLDAYAQIRTREPAIHVRVHENTPEWFLQKSTEIIQLGCGKPSFFGDEAIIRSLQGVGMTKEHARDYAIIGCVEMASQGRTYNSSDAALFNLPLCLELGLNEGHRFLGLRLPGKRFGARTPSPGRMNTIEDVIDAYRLQVRDAVKQMTTVIGWLEEVYREWRTTPINSIVTEGCLESGFDVTWGGAMYDLTSIQAAGLAGVGDSLYTIKKLIFEESRFSLEQFMEILKSDFEGYETLRTEIFQRFPKYGNGDPEADRMTQVAADVFSEEIRACRNSRGGQYIPGIYSMTCHNGFGKITGAMPNGRKARKRLSNGLSPVDGVDRNGPTAVLNSAASLDSRQWANCCALNLKFEKNSVQGDKGRLALSGLFKGYFKQGGMQLQVNVLDSEQLLQAKADPHAFPGLVVRVAGYCAYFNDLTPAVKDEIIERSTHRIGT